MVQILFLHLQIIDNFYGCPSLDVSRVGIVITHLLGILLLGSLFFSLIYFKLPLLTSFLCLTFSLGMAFLVTIFTLNIAIPLLALALVFRLEGFIL